MQPGGKYYGAAADYNKGGGLNFSKLLKFAGLFVGVIVLIAAGFFGYTFLTSAGKNNAAQLVAREKQLLAFITNNKEDITSDAFKTVSSNAISLLSSDSYALSQGLKTFGLTTVPEAITKGEADSTSAKTLANAKVQGSFDQVYLELLREKIAATESLARTVQSGSSGTMKTAVTTLLSNLSAIDSQLAKLQL